MTESLPIKAIAITGPTASGKTALSIRCAKELGCEIISCDSMQIYRGMDIGTAKATAEERASAPHHMLDILDPEQSFSAKSYRTAALSLARQVSCRGKIPLFVGGTGLYLDSLKRADCDEVPESCPEYREKILSELHSEEDRIALWERLRSVDPESAASVHYNNLRRVIRALEIYETTGRTKSYFDALSRIPAKEISICHVTLDFHERDRLYERIDKRVDKMLSEGLWREVEELYLSGRLPEGSTAAQAIGYKEIIEAIRLCESAASAAEKIKQASRNYAKRQLTWFRRSEGARVLFVDSDDGRIKDTAELFAELLAIIRAEQAQMR